MASIHLSTEEFKEKVFDFDTQKEWVYKGQLPALIDFYADWCGPCQMVAPIVEELATEYDGRIVIYKIDTEQEIELSSVFGIQSIPTFLFIPLQDTPTIQPGAVPKNIFKEMIESLLLPTSNHAQ
jgi:thioredoxin